MKLYKFIFCFLLLYFILFIPIPSFAFDTFTKNTLNPYNFRFMPNITDIYQGDISNTLNGLFSTHDSISGKQIISSGIQVDSKTWEISNRLIESTHDLYAPHRLNIDQSKYKLYFTDYYDRIYKIDVADCDGSACGPIQTALTIKYPWESKGVVSSHVIVDNDTYYMFYSGWDIEFRLAMATSTDGIMFNQCSEQPTMSIIGDGPFLFKYDNKYFLFFHSSNGIEVVESTDNIGCNMGWTNRKIVLQRGPEWYDQNHMVAPSVFEKDGLIYLFYTGLGTDQKLHFALATSGQIQAQGKTPIVIVPGFLGSWNKEAILHNQQVSVNDWKMLPFVKEYDGLKNTLKNLGYVENQDFMFFPYDWRKSVSATASDLDTFISQNITSKNPRAKVDIVGHSLGGLIGRVFTQNRSDKVDTLVTAGSPHLGTALAYKPYEAGDIDRNDSMMWLTEKIVLALNKNRFDTDKATIQSVLPVLKDLFPTYNFLKDFSGQEISVGSMHIKNDFLLSLNTGFTGIYPQTHSLVGQKGETLMGYSVKPRSNIDILLDRYPDGRPQNIINGQGDQTILSLSAQGGTLHNLDNTDHGEIMYTTNGIKTILDSLRINYQEDKLVTGAKTTVSPSLIFFMLSPATMTLQYQGNTINESDGLIYVENAQSGDYMLKVNGQSKGKYSVVLGQISNITDTWNTINGEINGNPPSSQIDSYSLHIDQSSPLSSPLLPQSLFDELISYLTDLNSPLMQKDITSAQSDLTKAKMSFSKKNLSQTKSYLLHTHEKLFHARQKINNQTTKRLLLLTISKLEVLYDRSLENYIKGTSVNKLTHDLKSLNSKLITIENSLLNNKNSKKHLFINPQTLSDVELRINKVDSAIKDNRLNLAEVLLETATELLEEAKES